MKHGIENIVIIKDLMYEGCEIHFGCKRCGEIYPKHCYKLEEMAERDCKPELIEKWSHEENRTW